MIMYNNKFNKLKSLKSNNNNDNNTKCNNIKCKYCNSNKINKCGKQNNKQRYRCKDCKRTFIIQQDERKKYSEEFKKEVIKWYLDNCGIRTIERRMKVSDTTIIRWIRKFGKMIKERLRNETIDNIPDDLKELKKKDNIEILEADEIMTYVKKNLKIKDKISGYGYLLIETAIKLLTLK